MTDTNAANNPISRQNPASVRLAMTTILMSVETLRAVVRLVLRKIVCSSDLQCKILHYQSGEI